MGEWNDFGGGSPRVPLAVATQHPQVRRLLGHVAEMLQGWRDDDLWEATDALAAIEDDLLSVAPEFVPPFDDEDHVPDDWQAWRDLVAGATNGRSLPDSGRTVTPPKSDENGSSTQETES